MLGPIQRAIVATLLTYGVVSVQLLHKKLGIEKDKIRKALRRLRKRGLVEGTIVYELTPEGVAEYYAEMLRRSRKVVGL